MNETQVNYKSGNLASYLASQIRGLVVLHPYLLVFTVLV